MKRGIMSEAVRNIDEEYRLEALNLLNQAEVSELTNMKQKNVRKIVTVAIAATMTLALGGVVAAKTGLFGMNVREAQPEETVKQEYHEYDPETTELIEEGVVEVEPSHIVNIAGVGECNGIEFKVGDIPEGAMPVGDFGDLYGWNENLQFCIEYEDETMDFVDIKTYYDPEFANGGVLYTMGNVINIEEGQIGDYETYKFNIVEMCERESYEEDDPSVQFAEDGSPIIPDVEAISDALILHHPDGYIFVITSSAGFDMMERVAEGLEIRKTDKVMEATSFGDFSFMINTAAG